MYRHLVIVLALSFGVQASADPYRFDAATSVALDGVFTEIALKTYEKDPTLIRDEITAQLFYLAGALNGFRSGADLGHVDVKILSSMPAADGSTDIRYEAKLLVGWDKATAVPPGIRIPFPARADIEGRKQFFAAYGKACSEDAPDADALYYYFRPDNQGCPLATGKEPNTLVSYALLTMRPSGAQTEGKYPEYDKVWADNRLVATLIFGTFDQGATSDRDAGIWAYNQMYTRLKQVFGGVSWVNHKLRPREVPGMRYPDIEMRWKLTGGREVNVNILLIDKERLPKPTAAFQKRYNERTRVSDFVSYNGHSGFGDNIRALAKMGTFLKGQYQIYFINGCDTFFYVDDSLRAAHEAVNPGSKPYEFFDVITNAMPSPFAQMAVQNAEILVSLFQGKDTYRDLLGRFNAFQRAIVLGEEDNTFHP